MDRHWVQDAVGYEIYLRSFHDTDGDGYGDLPGVLAKLDHLEALGVDIVWLTPPYPTPDADHGYDVADYEAIDPRWGTLDDLDRLVSAVHDRGMRLVMDIVPNHTSDQHAWFRDAVADPDGDRRAWYVWRDPAPDGGPPNNWVSHFGGPAWTLDEDSGQYYMHLFLPEQPDLNWHHQPVADEFHAILRRWFDRGVDGFRIDVVQSILEDQEFRDNPRTEVTNPRVRALPPEHPRHVFETYAHLHDLDQDDNPDMFRPWRELADEFGAALIGETYLSDPDRWARYVADGLLHTQFWFPTLHTGWDADEIGRTLEAALVRTGDRTSWPISSHDDPYAAERFGGGDVGAERALAFTTLVACLPGSIFLMQGEELGLDNAVVPAGTLADPISTRNANAVGRDGTRTPMLWGPGPDWGFGSEEPWIPFGTNRRPGDDVASQQADPTSHLRRMSALFHLRRELPRDGDAAFLDTPAGVVGVRNGATRAWMNTTDAAATIPLSAPATPVFRSEVGRGDEPPVIEVTVPADTTVVVTS